MSEGYAAIRGGGGGGAARPVVGGGAVWGLIVLSW